MATITLYADKINQMPFLLEDSKKSVSDYQTELFSIKSKMMTVNKSVCNLDDAISSVQTCTQVQVQKASSLEAFKQNVENFISDVVVIDNGVADIINQNKTQFYEEYCYLKPQNCIINNYNYSNWRSGRRGGRIYSFRCFKRCYFRRNIRGIYWDGDRGTFL